MAEPDVRATNAPEITVSELSNALKSAIEDRFGYVRVRGEISGYRGPHASGHAYFCLKDAGARLDAVIWRTPFLRMRVKPEEGLEVVATGRLTTFPGKSTYQIVIEQLELAGLGALMALLEARRKKLAEEGLFDAARKRQIPFLPKVVGVVTSPTGAVIRDILHRLADRFPVRVIVWPVRVQGETSAAEVAAAIDGFNAFPAGGRGSEARRPDRGARRRLARGPLELQRGDRRARRGAQRHSAHRRRRPRDRLDADRSRRRPARADADRGGRIRRAGARRAPGLAGRARRPAARRDPAPRPAPARRTALGRPRLEERRGPGRGAAPAARSGGRDADRPGARRPRSTPSQDGRAGARARAPFAARPSYRLARAPARPHRPPRAAAAGADRAAAPGGGSGQPGVRPRTGGHRRAPARARRGAPQARGPHDPRLCRPPSGAPRPSRRRGAAPRRRRLPRGAGARLCAGARRGRPAAPPGGRGQAGPAAQRSSSPTASSRRPPAAGRRPGRRRRRTPSRRRRNAGAASGRRKGRGPCSNAPVPTFWPSRIPSLQGNLLGLLLLAPARLRIDPKNKSWLNPLQKIP